MATERSQIKRIGRRLGGVGLGIVVVGLWVGACAQFDDEASPAGLADGFNTPQGGGNGGSAGTAGNGDGLPNEQELEDSFKAPGVSGTRMFSVNPTSGRVAIIDTQTLEVQLTQAGFAPIQVVALPKRQDLDRALVLNAGSHDATLFEVDSDWHIEKRNIPTHVGANRIDVSNDGQWAVIWTDFRQVANTDPTDGFQDVTLLQLDTAEATRLTVGFRPVVIAVSSERQVAYVSAEPGIDVIDLSGASPQVTHSIPFDQQYLAAAVSYDVRFTPDARYAFVRDQDAARLAVLNLQDEQWTNVSLSGAVTDLDLSDDGSTAVAVVRTPLATENPDPDPGGEEIDAAVPQDSGAPALLPVSFALAVTDAGKATDAGDAGVPIVNAPDAGGGPDAPEPDAAGGGMNEPPPAMAMASEVVVFRLGDQPDLNNPQIIRIDDELFGSVSVAHDGNTLALYTTATESDRITLVDLAQQSIRTVSVKSPVLAVIITGDARHAVSFQAPASDNPTTTRKGAFSLIPLQVERAPKIVATDAPLVSLGLVGGNDSFAGLVTTSDPTTNTYVSYRVAFPGLTADPIRLASEPLATGVVEQTGVGFVAQRHPEGRLTLVDLDSGVPRTLTGFELAAKVVE